MEKAGVKESRLFLPGIIKAEAEYEYLSGTVCSRFLSWKGVEDSHKIISPS